MSSKSRLTPLASAIGMTLAAGLLGSTAAQAADNPFAVSELPAGYQLAGHGKAEEGKCGAEGKAEEGKCGAEGKAEEGKCGAEGKAEEGKCGAEGKAEEGKCGEGKCGGEG